MLQCTPLESIRELAEELLPVSAYISMQSQSQSQSQSQKAS